MKNVAKIAFIALFLFVCSISSVKAEGCFDGTVPTGTKCLIEQPALPQIKPEEKETKSNFELFIIWFKSYIG